MVRIQKYSKENFVTVFCKYMNFSLQSFIFTRSYLTIFLLEHYVQFQVSTQHICCCFYDSIRHEIIQVSQKTILLEIQNQFSQFALLRKRAPSDGLQNSFINFKVHSLCIYIVLKWECYLFAKRSLVSSLRTVRM